MMMFDDTLRAFKRDDSSRMRGAVLFMLDMRANASWREAVFHTVGLWVFVLIIFFPIMLERHRVHDAGSVVLDSSTVLVSMLLALGLFLLFRRTLAWPNALRALVLMTGVGAAAILQTAFDFAFTGLIAQNFIESWQDLPRTIQRSYGAAFNYTCVFAVNVALFQLSFARRWSAARDRQLAEARERAQQAQLTALRYQLNPHFLFNTLNSISSLIVTRRNEDAEEMTEKLSNFLRMSLAFDPSELVPVDEELSLAEEYLDIESVRFGKKLQIEFDCEPAAARQLIPGFLVQPLVENAVKHGVARSRGLVTIRISARIADRELRIRIENDRPEIEEEGEQPVPGAGAGVGLCNVRRRLEAVYGDAATLDIGAEPKSFTAEIRIRAVIGRPAAPAAGDDRGRQAPAAGKAWKRDNLEAGAI
jgi:two-component sensor histidine kinase